MATNWDSSYSIELHVAYLCIKDCYDPGKSVGNTEILMTPRNAFSVKLSVAIKEERKDEDSVDKDEPRIKMRAESILAFKRMLPHEDDEATYDILENLKGNLSIYIENKQKHKNKVSILIVIMIFFSKEKT